MTSPMSAPGQKVVQSRQPTVRSSSNDEVRWPPEDARIGWIEIGRVAAILAVIAIHVASPLVIRPSHPESWWFGNLVESGSRWCVPVFVMVS